MKNWMMAGLFLGMTVAACGGDKTDGASSSTPSATPASSGKPAAGKSSSAPAKTDEAKEVTVADFTSKVPAGSCKAIAECKNQELSVGVGAMLIMVGAFGSMDDKDAQKEFKEIDEAQKKDNRFTLNADECGKVMAVVTKVTGFTADKVQASIDAKKAEFDGKKAGECLAALEKSPPSCATEKKLEKEPKLDDIDKMMKSYKTEMDDFVKPCQGALVGKVAEGGECAYDYECAGEKVDCKNKKCTKGGG